MVRIVQPTVLDRPSQPIAGVTRPVAQATQAPATPGGVVQPQARLGRPAAGGDRGAQSRPAAAGPPGAQWRPGPQAGQSSSQGKASFVGAAATPAAAVAGHAAAQPAAAWSAKAPTSALQVAAQLRQERAQPAALQQAMRAPLADPPRTNGLLQGRRRPTGPSIGVTVGGRPQPPQRAKPKL